MCPPNRLRISMHTSLRHDPLIVFAYRLEFLQNSATIHLILCTVLAVSQLPSPFLAKQFRWLSRSQLTFKCGSPIFAHANKWILSRLKTPSTSLPFLGWISSLSLRPPIGNESNLNIPLYCHDKWVHSIFPPFHFLFGFGAISISLRFSMIPRFIHMHALLTINLCMGSVAFPICFQLACYPDFLLFLLLCMTINLFYMKIFSHFSFSVFYMQKEEEDETATVKLVKNKWKPKPRKGIHFCLAANWCIMFFFVRNCTF